MWWLKKAAAAEPLAVSMSGVTLGDRLLVLGCGDAALIAQLALKTGLTGRACALDEDEGRTERAANAVEREGALIESITAPWAQLPLESTSFDVVVIRDVLASLDMHHRAPIVAEVIRVLRPGGRCIVIEGGPRGGLGALLQRRNPNVEYVSSGGAERALSTVGFRAVRMLADRGGLKFVEGVKPTV
jgi:ubiquinone/menaquinone biosynthesis C-methylase UbiE